MKNLIIQTYIKDNIERGKRHTYVPNPDLEKISRYTVQLYADAVGADYEYCTTPSEWYSEYSGAHWHRMVMFERPAYDNVLYLDCDVVVNPMMFHVVPVKLSPDGPVKRFPPTVENIFDEVGVGSALIHPGSERKIGWAGGINCGVTKWTKEQCEIMREHIHDYYHPRTNQEAINNCYADHIGYLDYFFYKWNVTHFQAMPVVGGINFRHYAGAQRDNLEQDFCYAVWKDILNEEANTTGVLGGIQGPKA